jgi:PAS domain S-box-containing protein
MICITDLDDRFIYLNDTFQKVYGYAEGEILGKTPEILLSPKNPPSLLQEVLKQSRLGGWRGEVIDRRKDGTELPIFLSTSQVKDQDGVVIGLMGVSQDITEAKKIEARLEELAAIVQSSEDGIISTTTEEIIVSWNKGAEHLLGYTAAEMIGENILMIVPPEQSEKARQIIRKVAQGESVESYEAVRRHKDGTLRDLSAKVSRVTNAAGKVTSIAVIYRDITARKLLEKTVLEISAGERQRIGYDLHDGLGQYLAGIAFKTKALEETLLRESPALAGEAMEISGLVNNAISQTRSLARGLAPVAVEVNGLLAALENLAAETKNLFPVHCVFGANINNLELHAQTGMVLYRITQEAIHNAATRGGADRITINLQLDDGRVCLTIRDDGKGFLVESKPKTGMGLRIMQYRANSIGGTLTIHSQIGKGTEVKCIVPKKL